MCTLDEHGIKMLDATIAVKYFNDFCRIGKFIKERWAKSVYLSSGLDSEWIADTDKYEAFINNIYRDWKGND